MSTHSRLRKNIKAEELFDGRLEAFGVREEVRPEGAADRYPPYMKVKEVRYLTDGSHGMEVVVYESGFADITVRNLWCAPEKKIFHAIAEAFDTKIVIEGQPEFYGFDTQEEWDAWNEQESRQAEESFHHELLKYLRGESNDIRPGTVGMIWAEIAKKLADTDPALLLPTNKHKLRKEIDAIYYDRERNALNEATSRAFDLSRTDAA
jgi:hypothetical protein